MKHKLEVELEQIGKARLEDKIDLPEFVERLREWGRKAGIAGFNPRKDFEGRIEWQHV